MFHKRVNDAMGKCHLQINADICTTPPPPSPDENKYKVQISASEKCLFPEYEDELVRKKYYAIWGFLKKSNS